MKVKTITLNGSAEELKDPELLREAIRDEVGEDIPDAELDQIVEGITKNVARARDSFDQAEKRFHRIKDTHKRILKDIIPKDAPKDIKRFAWFSLGWKEGWEAALREEEADD